MATVDSSERDIHTTCSLAIQDDQQDPAKARNAVKELLESKVTAIIGHMTSSMSTSTVSLKNDAGIVMISPTTTTTQLSGKDDFFLRVVAATNFTPKPSLNI